MHEASNQFKCNLKEDTNDETGTSSGWLENLLKTSMKKMAILS